MIHYTDSLSGISEEMLCGFFEGWPNPPSPESHLKILANSYKVWLALDDESDRVVGFINAISDGILSGYIPLLEVLPSYRNRGIASELMRRMMQSLEGLYMIDLTCDRELCLFYEKFDMKAAHAMIYRDFDQQSAVKER